MDLILMEHGYTKSLDNTNEWDKLRDYYFIIEKMKKKGGNDDKDTFGGSNL